MVRACSLDVVIHCMCVCGLAAVHSLYTDIYFLFDAVCILSLYVPCTG